MTERAIWNSSQLKGQRQPANECENTRCVYYVNTSYQTILNQQQNSDTTAQPVKRADVAKRHINQAYRSGALRAQNNFAKSYFTHLHGG
jgi:hypothetical protein